LGGQGEPFLRDCIPKWKKIGPVGNLLSLSDRFFAHLLLPEPQKQLNLGVFGYFRIGLGLAITQKYQDIVRDRERRIRLIPRVVEREKFNGTPTLGEGEFMYLLFGPSMAALIVIAAIQLRDHFVPSR
jgi:hypothetical protein